MNFNDVPCPGRPAATSSEIAVSNAKWLLEEGFYFTVGELINTSRLTPSAVFFQSEKHP